MIPFVQRRHRHHDPQRMNPTIPPSSPRVQTIHLAPILLQSDYGWLAGREDGRAKSPDARRDARRNPRSLETDITRRHRPIISCHAHRPRALREPPIKDKRTVSHASAHYRSRWGTWHAVSIPRPARVYDGIAESSVRLTSSTFRKFPGATTTDRPGSRYRDPFLACRLATFIQSSRDNPQTDQAPRKRDARTHHASP